MDSLIHEFSALYFIRKAQKGPTVGAKIPGHALHVLKTLLYRQGPKMRFGIVCLCWGVFYVRGPSVAHFLTVLLSLELTFRT